jgi:hypothetical protein
MKKSPGPRAASRCLSTPLLRRLNSYALAATASCVGLFTSAEMLQAEVVYTPANTPIEPGDTIQLDLNHDGIPDFTFTDFVHLATCTLCTSYAALSVGPAQSPNRVWGHRLYSAARASALPSGFLVGPKGQFSIPGNEQMVVESISAACSAGWGEVTNRYLAFEFAVNGEAHFGWARLNVHCVGLGVYATLTGYAYETEPNRPAITGLPQIDPGPQAEFDSTGYATLGKLALGADGLSSWRKPMSPAEFVSER